MLDPDYFECELLTVPTEVADSAAAEISGCESCSVAEIPFDGILADVLNRPGMFEFVLEAPVHYPMCHRPVTEKTLLDRVGGMDVTSTACAPVSRF